MVFFKKQCYNKCNLLLQLILANGHVCKVFKDHLKIFFEQFLIPGLGALVSSKSKDAPAPKSKCCYQEKQTNNINKQWISISNLIQSLQNPDQLWTGFGPVWTILVPRTFISSPLLRTKNQLDKMLTKIEKKWSRTRRSPLLICIHSHLVLTPASSSFQ